MILNKILKTLSVTCAVIVLSSMTCFSQKNYDTLLVHTSAVCGMCKERIETGLTFEKGVKSATLNIDDKVATIIYNPAKTSPGQLRTAISKIGYDADSVPADPRAYAKLPPCCKKDAPKH